MVLTSDLVKMRLNKIPDVILAKDSLPHGDALLRRADRAVFTARQLRGCGGSATLIGWREDFAGELFQRRRRRVRGRTLFRRTHFAFVEAAVHLDV